MRDILSKLRDILTPREIRHAGLVFILMVVGATLEMLGVGAIPAFIALLSDPASIKRFHFATVALQALPAHNDSTIVLWAAGLLLFLFLLKNLYLAALTI